MQDFLKLVTLALVASFFCSFHLSHAQKLPTNVEAIPGELSPIGFWRGEARCGGKNEDISIGIRHDWRTGNIVLGMEYERNPSYEIRSKIASVFTRSEKYALISYDPATRSGKSLDRQPFVYIVNPRPNLDVEYQLDSKTGLLRLEIKNMPDCDPIFLGRLTRQLDENTKQIRSGRINDNDEWYGPSKQIQRATPIIDGAGNRFEPSRSLTTVGYIEGSSLQIRPIDFCASEMANLTVSSPFREALSNLSRESATSYIRRYLSLECPSATGVNIEFRLRSLPDEVDGVIKTYDLGLDVNFAPPLEIEFQGEPVATAIHQEYSETRKTRVLLREWLGRDPSIKIKDTDFVGLVKQLDRLNGLQLPESWSNPCQAQKVQYAETNRYRFKDRNSGREQHTAGLLYANWDCESYELAVITEADQSVADRYRDTWNGNDPVFGLSYTCALDEAEDLIQLCMANPSDADRTNFEENACIPARSTAAAGLSSCLDPVAVHRAADRNRRDFQLYQQAQMAFDGFARSILTHDDQCILEPAVTTGQNGRPVVLGYQERCN